MDETGSANTEPYEAIGRVTAEGVLLEHSLKFLVMAIEFSSTLASYANAASLSQLIELARIARDSQRRLTDSQRTELTEILGRSEELRIARNEIVHALWRAEPLDQGTQERRLIGHKPTRRSVGMQELPARTIEEMRSIAAEIFALRDDMFAATYNLLISRASTDIPPIERHKRIANPHGATADGRSVPPEQVDVGDTRAGPGGYV